MLCVVMLSVLAPKIMAGKVLEHLSEGVKSSWKILKCVNQHLKLQIEISDTIKSFIKKTKSKRVWNEFSTVEQTVLYLTQPKIIYPNLT